MDGSFKSFPNLTQEEQHNLNLYASVAKDRLRVYFIVLLIDIQIITYI